MPIAYKILGQINPTANTQTTLYTAPASNQTVVSTVIICNQSAVAGTFKLALIPSGQSLSTSRYISFDTQAPSNDSVMLTLGLTMASGDSIVANVSSSNFSVSAYGSEIY
jgi:hypothetical protein